MIVAATAEGVCEIESGEFLLAERDVGFFACTATESWAIVAGRSVVRNDGTGWCDFAHLERGTALVAQPLGDGRLLMGTTGAHIVRVDAAEIERLKSFDDVAGRDSWTNPAAGGRPDVWSFACDRSSIFASVHVGGLWRSDDQGDSWINVLAPEVDVHQVAATDGLVAVAAEHGFGFSHDRGNSWSWTTDGLHASYLQCVSLTDDAVYVGASSGPMATDAAVYRASSPGAAFERRSAGLPETFESIGPYHLAGAGDDLAVAAWLSHTVFVSRDAGNNWATLAQNVPLIHSLVAA